MKLRFLIPAFIFGILIAAFAFMLHRTDEGYDPSLLPSALLGKAAPAIRLPKVEDMGQFVDTKEFVGRPYVVNVWATWCGGCRVEHPLLLEVARQNVVPIIGLDTKDNLEAAQKWLSTLGNPYTATAFDEDGKAAFDWGVYGAPETFLIDANGVVVYKHIGPLTLDVWQREFLSRLGASKADAGAGS